MTPNECLLMSAESPNWQLTANKLAISTLKGDNVFTDCCARTGVVGVLGKILYLSPQQVQQQYVQS